MLFSLKEYCILKIYLYFLNLNYINISLYFKGYFGFLKKKLLYNNFLNLIYWNKMIYLYIKELNFGYLAVLILNGLGFKATRKIFFLKKKYWRFNVGHSHIFQYFPAKNIILKVKNRNLFLFSYKKNKLFDITQILRTFHKPDIYKGIGIKYPNEVLKLKKGKIRQ